MRLADKPARSRGGEADTPRTGPHFHGSALHGGGSLDNTALDNDAIFDIAVEGFEAGRGAVLAEREDIAFEDTPAPKRLAPYAVALGATAHREGTEVGSGRHVLLYDPEGQEGWTGVFRLVAYVR